MKNKEIEELLDKLKDKDWYEELDLTGTKWIELKQEETNLLLSYIEQLEKTIKVKDEGIKAFTQDLCETTEKLEQLEIELKEEQEDNYKQSEWLVKKQKKIEQLENNRDKAIELLNELSNLYDDNYTVSDKAKDIIDILKGDSDD